LAFSGGLDLARGAQRLEISAAAVALTEGFVVNHHKTRILRSSQAQRLLGLVTNQRPNVPRAERDRLEAVLTNIVRHGLESQNRERHPQFLSSLRGRVAWIDHVNPDHAVKLRRLLAACETGAREPG
jgi:RNA-directed DNA polymerase